MKNKYGKDVIESLQDLSAYLHDHFMDGWEDSVNLAIGEIDRLEKQLRTVGTLYHIDDLSKKQDSPVSRLVPIPDRPGFVIDQEANCIEPAPPELPSPVCHCGIPMDEGSHDDHDPVPENCNCGYVPFRPCPVHPDRKEGRPASPLQSGSILCDLICSTCGHRGCLHEQLVRESIDRGEIIDGIVDGNPDNFSTFCHVDGCECEQFTEEKLAVEKEKERKDPHSSRSGGIYRDGRCGK